MAKHTHQTDEARIACEECTPNGGNILTDVDKAMASIPPLTCYEDYTKEWKILPGGGVEEIKKMPTCEED